MTDPTTDNALNVAERLAPIPETREQATTEAWVRHYAALALAAHVEFRKLLSTPGPHSELGYLVAIGVSATAAVQALVSTSPADVAGELWDLTPEYGALNGEWTDFLVEVLDAVGVNPADIDPWLTAVDFKSPSRKVARDV